MHAFQPPVRLLMGPGPSNVAPAVLAAQAKPTIGHLDPEFCRLMDDIKGELRLAFRTQPRDLPAFRARIARHGDGARHAARARRHGDRRAERRVRRAHGRHRPARRRRRWSSIAANGARRSTRERWRRRSRHAGGEARRVRACGDLDRRAVAMRRRSARWRATPACSAIVDAVTCLGGIPVLVDEWGADVVYSGTQKCLSAPPGLAPITFSARAVEAVKARKMPVQSWFLDLGLMLGYWDGEGGRSYHHTAPINTLYGLHESLRRLFAEGLEAAWRGTARCMTYLAGGLKALGLDFLVDAGASPAAAQRRAHSRRRRRRADAGAAARRNSASRSAAASGRSPAASGGSG